MKQAKNLSKVTNQKTWDFKDSYPFQVTFWISPCRKSHLSRRPPRQCPDLPPRQCPVGFLLEIPQWAFWLQKLDDCSEEVVDDKSIYPLAQKRIGIGFGWNRSKTLSSQHHARCQVIMKPCLRAAKYKSPHIRPYCRPHTCLKTTISILHCQKHITFLKGPMALCFKYRVCNPSYDQRILKNTSRCASKSIQSINNWARHNRCDECLKASRSIELPETLRADCKSLTRKNALKYSN